MSSSNPSLPPETVIVARQAMATRFEIALPGDDPVRLRAAAEEALMEIERWEGLLSPYRPSSEIARVNARAAREPVRVSPPVLRLLEHAARLSLETGGAFDLTVGPLMQAWGFRDGAGGQPGVAALAEARACTGMHLVDLDAARCTVRFARDGVRLDPGAIGKGYAVEVAAEILREAGVTSALIHGGTSTVLAIGRPPDLPSWRVAIPRPPNPSPGAEPESGPLALVDLHDEALSVSGVWGRSFVVEGRTYGHVLDPRSGEPVQGAVMAAVALRGATETDALSTALLVLGEAGLGLLERLRPGVRALTVSERGGGMEVGVRGIPLRPA